MPETAPCIAPVPVGMPRPLWSVMIPTFNCAKYLRQTLESVLAQDPGSDQMQIEVVDDCSTKDDPESVVREVGQGRVQFHRKAQNGGAGRNFNTCIERGRGELVHILHGDDWVSPGFYAKVGHVFQQHADTGLVAARSFFVEEDGAPIAVTPRLKALETPSRETAEFYYQTPVQTPGVVVRRAAYERLGGFLLELIHTADCEMWARVISQFGGVVMPEALAHYRCFASNDTGRLVRTGENVRDVMRLNGVFSARFKGFEMSIGQDRAADMALAQAQRFMAVGDYEPAQANMALWRELASSRQKLRRMVRNAAKGLLHNLLG